MGETRVDLLHLLEDLRDAYPGTIEETILTEIVANALDGGATSIALLADPTGPFLTVRDDGSGMTRRELARYHDLATSTKERGRGIGFAGVGIKLGLLVAHEVRTETRRGASHVMSAWGLSSRRRAPWRWVPPEGLVADRGTAVRLVLQSSLSPLVDPGFIEQTLRRHYAPLLDPSFAGVLAAQYPSGVRLSVNGRPLEGDPPPAGERVSLSARLARKRKPAAFGWLVRADEALPEEQAGIAISTYGKVIKRGWEWLGVSPAAPSRVAGLIEAPGLAGSLTLNKADFLRSGPRGSTYLAYRKALQEIVSEQLAAWGDRPAEAERAQRRVSRPLERDLESVLADLSRRFPLLATLVEARAGGQRKLPIGEGTGGAALAPGIGGAAEAPALPAPEAVLQPEGEPAPPDAEPAAPEPAQPAVPESPPRIELPGGTRRRRPARYGLSIRFESRPDEDTLARLVETTVWVNEAHPACRRAAASRSEGYHLALATAMALAPLAAEPGAEPRFLAAFLAEWGRAADRRPARGRRR
jgi:hypothetical protein